MKKSTTPFRTIIKALLSCVITVGGASLFLFILICIFYFTDPTCESFTGEYELMPCSFGEYIQDLPTMFILIGGIPFLSICLYPFSWVALSAANIYRASHKKTVFPEMWKTFFRLSISCVVSLVVSFVIISFYNSYLIDTLNLIEGGRFSNLIFLVWPLSYYGIYRLITNKVAKIK